MSLHTDLERFLDHLRYERRVSPRTLDGYGRDLFDFTNWLGDQGLDGVERLVSGHVRQYAAARHRAGLGPKSLQRHLSAIRGWCRYLIREGRLASNPAEGVRAPKAEQRLPGR